MEKVQIDFIGVGAPRCGTTWIADCLMEHPEICFPYTKELNYFSKTRANHTKSEYEIRGIKGYYNLFAHCRKKKIKGEYSTYYMVDMDVAKIIKKYFPKIKIIIALRNPVERAYSDYKNVKHFHLKEKRNFEEAFNKTRGLDSYKERGMYYKQVKKYVDLFPRKNIKIIFMEDIIKNPKKVIQDLYQFLKVDSSFSPSTLNKKSNPPSKIKYRKLKKFINSLAQIYRFLEKKGCGKALSFIKRRTKINEIIWKVEQKNKIKETKKDENKLTPELRKRLIKTYIKDIAKLEKLIKKDLKKWKK